MSSVPRCLFFFLSFVLSSLSLYFDRLELVQVHGCHLLTCFQEREVPARIRHELSRILRECDDGPCRPRFAQRCYSGKARKGAIDTQARVIQREEVDCAQIREIDLPVPVLIRISRTAHSHPPNVVISCKNRPDFTASAGTLSRARQSSCHHPRSFRRRASSCRDRACSSLPWRD